MKSKNVLVLGALAAFLLVALAPSSLDASTDLEIDSAYYQVKDTNYYVTVEFNNNPSDYGLTGVVYDKNGNALMDPTHVAGVSGTKMSFKLDAPITADGAYVTFTDGSFILKEYIKCKITYMDKSDKGEFEAVKTEYLNVGGTVTYTPEKSGYDFDGWYTDSGLSKKWTGSVSKTMALYAKWSVVVKYTIEVKSAGNGTIASNMESARSGEDVTLTLTPSEGYDFKDWKSKTPSDLKIKWSSANKYTFTMPAENVSITAEFAKLFTVTVTDDGHGIGGAYPSPAIAGTEISLSASPNDGYKFNKWQVISGSISIINDSFTMPANNVTVKATFSSEEYAITLEGNGGTSGSAAVKYLATSLASYDAATYAGYKLSGYYTSATGGTLVLNANGSFASASGYIEGGKWVKTEDTVLYAQWIVNTYAITLDKNGAGQNGSAKATYGSSSLNDFSGVTRAGYTLLGYYTSATGGVMVISASGLLQPNASTYTDASGKWIKDSNATLYAQWNAKTAVITLESSGGTGGDASVTATSGQTLPAFALPAKEGFGLRGYYTSAADGTRVIDGSGKLLKSVEGYTDSNGKWLSDVSAVTLYAQWGQILTVTYDPCEGTISKTTDTVVEGLAVDLPTPTRHSYVFKGWYTQAEGGVKVDSPYAPTASITLYAHWAEGYVVTYDPCGGTVSKTSDTVEKGTSVALPTPTRNGYVFKGWYTQAEGGTKASSPYTPAGAVTLYAHWAEAYTVTYDPCGGTVSKASDTVEKGTSVALPTPTREGYEFKGWYTKASEGTKIASPYTPTASITLYAQWYLAGMEYTITVGNDGNGNAYSDKDQAKVDEVITLTAIPKSGYSFSKWVVIAPSSLPLTKVSDSQYTFVMPEENVEVRALFLPKEYTDVTKTVANGSVTIPAAVAKELGITDMSKLNLKIDSVSKPVQSNIPSNALVYEISMSYNGKSLTTFSQKVEVKISCPVGKDVSGYGVYFVSQDGKTVEDMKATYKNGSFVFETGHFSTFAASPTAIKPIADGTDNTMIMLIIAIVALIVIVAVIVLLVRKKKQTV